MGNQVVPTQTLIWYCLLVAPQREVLTKRIIEQLGYQVSVPMETKIGMRNGKPWEKEYPLLGPRYLFVGAQEYPWQLTHNIHLVNGFVQQEGEPAVFSTKTIKALDRISRSGYNDTIGLTVRHKAYRIGQPVRITTPPFEGHSAHVLEIERARIRVLIDLLGSPQAVWIDWEGVENV